MAVNDPWVFDLQNEIAAWSWPPGSRFGAADLALWATGVCRGPDR